MDKSKKFRIKIKIPKIRKKNTTYPKSQRLISLTSSVDSYIWTDTLLLHPPQHAYQIGKSTKTALLELPGQVQDPLIKEAVVCVFLDIEGTFDNIPHEAVKTVRRTDGCRSCSLPG